ncbi:ubiquinol-cytochrome c reductase ubiquinone-binding protein [Nomia melanderi]|uniref:ubiquinol-cytochrome c reductase ubiquinone-binding protein n=1 Tax=Nomia melanderi TaxID=2448451 RepID=UPI0013045755|nr:cytochrome b-c1 complex subunit 8 [Nomia melanderi]
MGKTFGELAKVSGVTFFRLSPYEQKPFAGVLTNGVRNTIRRFNDSMVTFVPFGLMTYMLMEWADDEYHKSQRKNPADFANDK